MRGAEPSACGPGTLTRAVLSPQSSLYSEEGLGVTVLSTLYGAMLLSSMFLPPLLIRMLGCKWTIVLSMSCYVTFSLGNFYASWYSPQLAALGSRVQGGLAAWDTQLAHSFPRPLPAHCLRLKMSSAS